MEWLIDVALAAMFGLCALSMLRAILRDLRRNGQHRQRPAGSAGFGAERAKRAAGEHSPEDLRAERQRLDVIIADAEPSASGRCR